MGSVVGAVDAAHECEENRSKLGRIAWVGPTTHELEWVYCRLSGSFVIEQYPDWDAWTQRLQVQSGSSLPDRLLVSLNQRDPRFIVRLSQWQQEEPLLPIALLLGEYWQGSRRTYGDFSTIPTFYWYQLADQLVPWLLAGSSSQGDHANILQPFHRQTDRWLEVRWNSHAAEQSTGNDSRSSPLESILLLTPSHSAASKLVQPWLHYIRATGKVAEVAYSIDVDCPSYNRVVLVVDSTMDVSAEVASASSLIQKITTQLPGVEIGVVVSQPIYAAWEHWEKLGATMIFGLPLRIDGLVRSWTLRD